MVSMAVEPTIYSGLHQLTHCFARTRHTLPFPPTPVLSTPVPELQALYLKRHPRSPNPLPLWHPERWSSIEKVPFRPNGCNTAFWRAALRRHRYHSRRGHWAPGPTVSSRPTPVSKISSSGTSRAPGVGADRVH